MIRPTVWRPRWCTAWAVTRARAVARRNVARGGATDGEATWPAPPVAARWRQCDGPCPANHVPRVEAAAEVGSSRRHACFCASAASSRAGPGHSGSGAGLHPRGAASGAHDRPQARGRREACALRHLRQHPRPRSGRARERAHLGGQPPWLFRGRGDVLEREQQSGRGPGLARAQSQPSGIRRQRSPAVGACDHGGDRRRRRAPARPGRCAAGGSARALHGRGRRRAVRRCPSRADPRRRVPRRGGHTGLEAPARIDRVAAGPRAPRHGGRGRPPRGCRTGHARPARGSTARLDGPGSVARRPAQPALHGTHLAGGVDAHVHRPPSRGRAHRRPRHPHPSGVGVLRPDRQPRHGPRNSPTSPAPTSCGYPEAIPGCSRAPRVRPTSCATSGGAGNSSPMCSNDGPSSSKPRPPSGRVRRRRAEPPRRRSRPDRPRPPSRARRGPRSASCARAAAYTIRYVCKAWAATVPASSVAVISVKISSLPRRTTRAWHSRSLLLAAPRYCTDMATVEARVPLAKS